MRTAVGQRGVAVVVIPGDILRESATASRPPAPRIRTAAGIARPGDAQLTRAAGLLNRATSVTILAGAGCQDAREGLLAIAQRLAAPVVHTLRGKEFVEHDNPFDVGLTGLLGFASGYYAMEHRKALLISTAAALTIWTPARASTNWTSNRVAPDRSTRRPSPRE